jgi:hypothetical protein
MIALHGLSNTGVSDRGGGHEGGTVLIATGASSPGTRVNGGETDDSMAGGPSWDQIFLKHVPALAKRDASGAILGRGYVTASCDARVDSFEKSTQCLTYTYTTREEQCAVPGGTATENAYVLPELDPARLYADLFAGFMPGGTGDDALKALRMRKSVLDSALRELSRVGGYVPAAERPKIDAHAEAIRKIEQQLSDQISTGGMGCAGVMGTVPSFPVEGRNAQQNSYYGTPTASEDESATHAEIGAWHVRVIRAAFQCDLLRVATFQWAPGQSDVSFGGMDSMNPATIYRHHPLSHRSGNGALFLGPPPTSNETDRLVYEFLTNVNKWYNQKTAELLVEFKNARDAFGGNLLDHTIIPYITEIGDGSHQRNRMAAAIFGGRALGMQGGQFQQLTNAPYNNLWATIAQAYFDTTDPLATPELSGEIFVKTNVAPIPGLWVRPQ